jgi:ABC-2 type transport system ATP-binding protein
VISVHNLVKRYGDFTAVSDLSFTVNTGETLGLLGTNGAGKSTTIQILTGQLLPTAGQVRVLDKDPSFEPKAIHQEIGYIPDQQSLYEDLTSFDNIDLFRKIHNLPKSVTTDMIEKLGLTEKSKKKVKTLSKGLKQRVLIGRSLLHQPKVLFLDEPTSGLDPSSANTICALLEELKKNGTTILLTTHLMNEVDRLCDQVIFIHEGKKIEEGTPFELKMKYSKPILKWTLKNETGFSFQEQDMNSPLIFEKMRDLYSKKTLVHFEMHLPTLEDVFIHIVKDPP